MRYYNKFYHNKAIIINKKKFRPASVLMPVFLLAAFLAVFCSCPLEGRAFEHGYERMTDFIYAVARHGMTVYDEPGGEVVDFIPDFEGVVAIGEDGSWYEVRYKHKKKKRYGYVTKDEFRGSGLEYDGRDKQIIADGNYRMELYSGQVENTDITNVFNGDVLTSSFLNNPSGTYNFTYVGNHGFHIRNNSCGLYLGLKDKGSDDEICWTGKETASSFVLIRNEDSYRIVEQSSRKYLAFDQMNGLVLTRSAKESYSSWRLMRTRKAIKEGALRCFCQYDPEWAHYHYGKGNKQKVEHGNFSTSGCGALATFNAIYAVSGQLPDLFEIAEYASDKGYRIEGAGTDSDFFKAAASHFSYKYGIAYDGSNDSFESLQDRLASGDVAVVYLPGHYSTIVSYSSKKDKYLLLDPHKLPRRGTSEWGNWVSREDLSSGYLYAQAFYYFRRIDDPD